MSGISKPMLGTPLNLAHPLAQGLVGCWLFNEGSGNKVYDLSGNNNHGTLSGFSDPPTATSGWCAGPHGGALRFDGSDDYGSIGLLPGLLPSLNSGGISICVGLSTIYTAAIAGIVGSINTGNNSLLSFVTNRDKTGAYVAGKTQFELRQEGSTTLRAEMGYNIYDGILHNVCLTSIPSTNQIQFYVDGQAKTTSLSSAATLNNFANFQYPVMVSASNNRGTITAYNTITLSYLILHSRAISATEVAQLSADPYCMFATDEIFCPSTIPAKMHHYRELMAT